MAAIIDFLDLITADEFCEPVEVDGVKIRVTTPQTLARYIERAEKEGSPVTVVKVVGRSRIYLKSELQALVDKYKPVAGAAKVHADQHREVVEHRDRLAVQLAELQARYNDLETYMLEGMISLPAATEGELITSGEV
jgi:hypothetical protein